MMIRFILRAVILGWASHSQAAICENTLLHLGFSAELFAACAIDSASTRQVFLALDADLTGLARLESDAADLHSAASDLENARRSLATASEPELAVRRAEFVAKQALYEAAMLAFENARNQLRQTAYGVLNPSQRNALDRSQRQAAMFLPVQYRHLDWPDERLRELERALTMSDNPSHQSTDHATVIATARAEESVHIAEAWAAFHLEAIQLEFSSRPCD